MSTNRVRLVRDLSVGAKLGLIGAAFGIPILVLLYLLVAEQNVAIALARNERRGLEMVAPLRAVLAQMQAHRNANVATLAHDQALGQKPEAAAAKVEAALASAETTDKRLGSVFGASDGLRALRQKWQDLRGRPLRLQEAYDQYTALIETDAVGLIVDVGNAAKIIRDPDVDTYWLMDHVILKAPALRETLSKVRALTAIALSDEGSIAERTLVRSQASTIPELMDSVERGLVFVMRATPMLEAPLKSRLEALKTATDELVIDIESRFTGETEAPVGRWLAEFSARTDHALQALDMLADVANTQLDARLADRIARLDRNRLGSLSAVFLIIALTTLLLVWLAQAITRPVTQLAEAAARLSNGDLSVQVPVTSGDEIGRLTATFNQTVQKLRGQVQTEVERDRERQQREELQHNISRFLDTVMEVAGGDLVRRGEVTADVLGSVVDAINVMLDEISGVLVSVQAAAERVSSGAAALSASAEQLTHGAQTQSREAASVSSALEQMSRSVRQVAGGAEASSAAAERVQEAADLGNQAVTDSLQGMHRIRAQVQTIAKRIKGLGERSLDISEIVNTIEDIASQTNLLALNAAIEAAGAGEAGLRFGVVADEVRKLAERSANAAKEITTLIKNVQVETQETIEATEEGTSDVESGYAITVRAGDSLREISGIARTSADLARDISLATHQQVRSADDVSKAVQSIADLATQAERSALETRRTVDELTALAAALSQTLGRFTLPHAHNGKHDGLPAVSNGRPEADAAQAAR
jgi:twitching motility protein PilJ